MVGKALEEHGPSSFHRGLMITLTTSRRSSSPSTSSRNSIRARLPGPCQCRAIVADPFGLGEHFEGLGLQRADLVKEVARIGHERDVDGPARVGRDVRPVSIGRSGGAENCFTMFRNEPPSTNARSIAFFSGRVQTEHWRGMASAYRPGHVGKRRKPKPAHWSPCERRFPPS